MSAKGPNGHGARRENLSLDGAVLYPVVGPGYPLTNGPGS